MIHYAITDVHGRLDLLEQAYDAIVAHASGRPSRIVFLGDAIDRGPDSKGVISRLIAGAAQPNFDEQINLLGNHEALMIKALGGEEREVRSWLANGGVQAVLSYEPGIEVTPRSAAALKIPSRHWDWLASLRYVFETDTHIFVHAGIPPRTTVTDALQTEEGRRQLIWIRNAFLDVTYDFGKHVVHGHSPVGLVDFMPDPPFRTNLDSGAVYGGPLTIGVCLPGVVGPPERIRIGGE
jgi:serine/threonine protein phosphatase 1